jgi:hypothetical protein
MTDDLQTPASELRHFLDIDALKEWLEHQRWYASKSRRVSSIEIDESVVLSESPMLLLALVQAVFATGQHELYQLPLGFRREGDVSGPEAIAVAEGWSVYDALADPDQALELLRRIDASEDLESNEGCLRFRRADGPVAVPEDADVRPVGVEQSNSSLVFGGELVLKVFRRLEPGINPELELLRFLTARLVRVRRTLVRRHPRGGAGVPPRRTGRMGARPERDRGRSRGLPRAAWEPWDGDRGDALGARLRRQRPGLQPGGAERRGPGPAHGDDRRGRGASVRAPAR